MKGGTITVIVESDRSSDKLGAIANSIKTEDKLAECALKINESPDGSLMQIECSRGIKKFELLLRQLMSAIEEQDAGCSFMRIKCQKGQKGEDIALERDGIKKAYEKRFKLGHVVGGEKRIITVDLSSLNIAYGYEPGLEYLAKNPATVLCLKSLNIVIDR